MLEQNFSLIFSLFVALLNSILAASVPTSPNSSTNPNLERFYSAKSSLGSRSDHHSSHQSLPPSPTSSSPDQSASSSHSDRSKKSSSPTSIARKMTVIHSAGAAHSMAKASVMTPVQFCAGAIGCVRQEIKHATVKMNPTSTPEDVEKSKKVVQEQRKHLFKAPKGELLAGKKNSEYFIQMAKQDRKAAKDLKKQKVRQEMITTTPTRTTNGLNRFTDQALKDAKQELKQHTLQQWKASGHIIRLGATGKDSQLSL